MTIHENTPKRGMFLILNGDNEPMALVNEYSEDERGIWTWFGLVYDGTATPIFPGMILRNWNMLDDDGRCDYVVVKVNRVTIAVQRITEGVAEGRVKSIRIDR